MSRDWTPKELRYFQQKFNLPNMTETLILNINGEEMPAYSEEQKETATGASLNRHGLALNPSFAGTGYNQDVRVMRTGDTRLYLFEEISHCS